jgi:NAD(P)-dependent dehydrogenase (short-subunit alcohol dehydrogenase family)
MDKTAVVTGAGSGVGRATAHALNKAGWRVALIGRREDALRETAGHEKADGRDAYLVLPTDVSDHQAVAAAFAQVEQAWGRLDLLFNNAGSGTPATVPDELAVEKWLAVVGANLNGSFFCAREAFRIMRAQSPQGGRIINNGSISAHAPRPGSIAYTTTKHAITGLTKSLSLDGRAFDIVASQIDIGNAVTPMTERMTTGVPQPNGTMMVEPRMDVAHVADMIVHIAALPLEANVATVTVMATKMPFVGRG